MKNILHTKVFLLIVSISFLNCNLVSGQQTNDELGIKNEKDFVTYIKSLTNNENIISENQTSKKYKKVVKTSTQVLTINIDVKKDNSGNNLDVYRGDIYTQDLSKYQSNGPNGFKKSDFYFVTYRDIISGKIIYYTGPAPYSSGASIVEQFVDSKKASQAYESVPSVYIALYQFEIEKEEIKDTNRGSDDKEEESVGEIKETEVVDIDESEIVAEGSEISETKEDRKKIIEETERIKKKSEKQKVYIDSLRLEEKKFKDRYYKVGGDNTNELSFISKYKILSEPKLLEKKYFWQENGSMKYRNHGFSLILNPKNEKDTLSYKFYNPKRNGEIKEYKIQNGKKVQIESGFYKNGKTIGERIVYKLDSRDFDYETTYYKLIDYKTFSDPEGYVYKQINYSQSLIKHPDNKDGHDTIINYPSSVANYNTNSGLRNGEYQEYQLIPYYVIGKNDFNILSTPILKISGTYQEGKKIGVWKEFYNNKILKSITNYTTGESETYNEKGELMNKTYKKN